MFLAFGFIYDLFLTNSIPQQTECVSKLLKENQITNETDLKSKSQFEELESNTDLKK